MRPALVVLAGVIAMSTTAAAPSEAVPDRAVASAAAAPADRAAIERIVADQAKAWNRHDMHAFAADMTPDVDWINIVGMHWQGRDAVERAHAALHRMPLFAESCMVPGALTLRPLTPDVILAVEHSRVEGAGPTPGGEPYPASGTIGTFLFVRTHAGWRIAHGHNTTIDAKATTTDPARSPAALPR